MDTNDQAETPEKRNIVAVFIHESSDDPEEDMKFGELIQGVKGLYDISGREGFRAYVVVEERATDIISLLEQKKAE